MKMCFLRIFTVCAALTASLLPLNAPARAALVTFDGSPSSSFADGTFSNSISGSFSDGFYNFDQPNYRAYNGYGQNNEYITFNAPVTVNSLKGLISDKAGGKHFWKGVKLLSNGLEKDFNEADSVTSTACHEP